VLKDIETAYKKDQSDDKPHYTSNITNQSYRPGAATHSTEYEGIDTVAHIMPRGAWKGEKILTVCNYLTSTVKSDIRRARVLSEWETTNGGGICPGISL
jgi:hypothetical protein